MWMPKYLKPFMKLWENKISKVPDFTERARREAENNPEKIKAWTWVKKREAELMKMYNDQYR